MKMVNIIFAMCLSVCLVSCASVGISKKKYNTQIKKVNIGMSKESFLKIFPEAVPRGAKKYSDGIVEVLEVDVAQYAFFPTGEPNRNEWTGMEGHHQWFYFEKAELIQYGQPNDWPKDPDQIIEVRSR